MFGAVPDVSSVSVQHFVDSQVHSFGISRCLDLGSRAVQQFSKDILSATVAIMVSIQRFVHLRSVPFHTIVPNWPELCNAVSVLEAVEKNPSEH